MTFDDQFDQMFAPFVAAFGDQERLCEVGVFVLGPDGWLIHHRKKFTQFGSASEWGKYTLGKLVRQKRRQRYRISVVSEPETLEGVLADYEAKRAAGDPGFIPLK